MRERSVGPMGFCSVCGRFVELGKDDKFITHLKDYSGSGENCEGSGKSRKGEPVNETEYRRQYWEDVEREMLADAHAEEDSEYCGKEDPNE